jgi:hypothetical protein
LVLPIQQQLLLRCFTARDLADLAWSTARLEPLRRSGRWSIAIENTHL